MSEEGIKFDDEKAIDDMFNGSNDDKESAAFVAIGIARLFGNSVPEGSSAKDAVYAQDLCTYGCVLKAACDAVVHAHKLASLANGLRKSGADTLAIGVAIAARQHEHIMDDCRMVLDMCIKSHPEFEDMDTDDIGKKLEEIAKKHVQEDNSEDNSEDDSHDEPADTEEGEEGNADA